jgi:CRP/FNR family transcriptional regulator, anaerobic regulatory protein
MKKLKLSKKISLFNHNKCKKCHVAHQCLPAKLNASIIGDYPQLKFKSITLKKGDYLSRQSHNPDTLYAVQVGTLKSVYTKTDGSEFIMGFHMPPHLFGWESLDKPQHSLSIIALEHCNICHIPRDQLNALMSEIPELSQQLLTISGRQIRQNNLNLLRTSALQRIASFLLQLKPHYRMNRNQNFYFPFVMTQGEIANYLRLSAETLSRHFKQLQQQQIIRLKHRKIEILDINQLNQIAEYVEAVHNT